MKNKKNQKKKYIKKSRIGSVASDAQKGVWGLMFTQIPKNALQYKHDTHDTHAYCAKWGKIRLIFRMRGKNKHNQNKHQETPERNPPNQKSDARINTL